MYSKTSYTYSFALVCLVSVLSFSNLAQAMDKEELSEECYEILHDEKMKGTEQELDCLNSISKFPTTLVITPMRRAQDLAQAPSSVAVVNKTQVSSSTANDLSELVRDVPGIEVTDAGQAGLKRIRIRGEESRRVAILIDGQSFTDEREVGTPLLISPDMVERIEILRGTSSVLHGSRGLGGVVNIITKKGGYHPIQGSISSSFDTATEGSSQFFSLFGAAKGIDYRLGYTMSNHGNRESAEEEVENTKFENDSLSVFLGKEFKKHNFALSYDNYNSESDVYVDPVVASTPPFLDFRIDAPKRDRSKAALFYDWKAESEYLQNLHIDLYYQESERQFNTFSDLELDFGAGPFVRNSNVFNDSTTDTFGTNLVAEFNIDSHVVVAGLDAKTSSLEQTRMRELFESGEQQPGENVFHEAQQDSVEVFVQDEWSFIEDWSLIAGARGFWYQNELEETTREGLSPNTSDDLSAVASLGVKHSIKKSTTVWSTWSQGYVIPTLINTSVGAFAGPDFVTPNADLDSERSNSFDLGMRHVSDKISIEFSAFYSRAKDYIDHVSCKSATVSCIEPAVGRRDRVYVNIDEATTFGAELATSYELTSYFTPYVNLSWLRRRFETQESRTYLTGLPTVSSRVGLRSNFALSSALKAWTDVYLRSASRAKEIDGEEVIEIAGWSTLNISTGIALLPKQSIRVVIDFLNINDSSYSDAAENIPARGRSAIVKVVADL